jgi:hypothetical protein
MIYHYETQPLPNPLSWYLHQLPPAAHKFEVLINHFVELIVPWFLFAPRRLRIFGGLATVLFQVLLILSGNLSWLNWLTITACIACFDDQALAWLFPRRLRERVAQLPEPVSVARQVVAYAVVTLVVYLSINPVLNMVSSHQMMNSSFDRLDLVNTYGAFGSIGRRRPEIILQGTSDDVITESTQWRDYELKCKPGDVDRRPCVVAPYHYRLDWQIWFAAMSDYRHEPWLVHFIDKLLHNDADALSLLATNPFPDRPPKFIRAELYEYQFTRFADHSKAWWKRKRIDTYLPPLRADDPALRAFIEHHGW